MKTGKHWMTNTCIDKKYKRSGFCNFKKCKAACCRFIIVGRCEDEEQKKYLEGFGFSTIIQGGIEKIILKKDCKYLDLKTFKCKRQNTKSICCYHFPINTDGVYKKIRNKCSYRFEDGEILISELNK